MKRLEIWIKYRCCSIIFCINRSCLSNKSTKINILGYIIFKKPINNKVSIKLKGALLPSYYGNLSMDMMNVWIQLMAMKEGPSNTSKIRQSDIILLQVHACNYTVNWVVVRLFSEYFRCLECSNSVRTTHRPSSGNIIWKYFWTKLP